MYVSIITIKVETNMEVEQRDQREVTLTKVCAMAAGMC